MAAGKCSRCKTQKRGTDGALCGDCRGEPRIRYWPIDEVLREMAVRVLLMLKHHDWVSQPHIAEHIAPGTKQDASAMYQAMTRLTKRGHVDRQLWMHRHLRKVDNGYWFRITQEGREWLEKQLTTDDQAATDEEIAQHDAELAQYGRSAA